MASMSEIDKLGTVLGDLRQEVGLIRHDEDAWLEGWDFEEYYNDGYLWEEGIKRLEAARIDLDSDEDLFVEMVDGVTDILREAFGLQ